MATGFAGSLVCSCGCGVLGCVAACCRVLICNYECCYHLSFACRSIFGACRIRPVWRQTRAIPQNLTVVVATFQWTRWENSLLLQSDWLRYHVSAIVAMGTVGSFSHLSHIKRSSHQGQCRCLHDGSSISTSSSFNIFVSLSLYMDICSL